MAVFDDVVKEGKLKIFDKGIEWKDGQPVTRQTAESTLFFPEIEPLREELAHFVDCVRVAEEAARPTAPTACACCACSTPASGRSRAAASRCGV